MRHDPKYSQSHLAAVRQRQPNNGVTGGGVDSMELKNFYYHHGGVHQHHNHGEWSSGGIGSNGYGYNSHRRGSSSSGSGGIQDAGGRVSALSEFENQDTEKQWIWLEDVMSKSKNNGETVSSQMQRFFFT